MLLELLRDLSRSKRIIIYCAGNHGKQIYRIMKMCDIVVHCFVDNDSDKWSTDLLDGIPCIKPAEIEDKDSCVVFIAVARKRYDSVCENARNNGFVQIVLWEDVFDDIIKNHKNLFFEIIKYHANVQEMDLFYVHLSRNNEMRDVGKNRTTNKIVVYTSVFGEYDNIYDPKFVSDDIDYYYVSEYPVSTTHVFQWIDSSLVIPANIDSPVKKNRFIKMHPQLLFPDYQYSVYIDGNIEVLGDMSLLNPMCASGISVFKHPERDCIYYEGITIANYKRVPVDEVQTHLKRYLSEGYPLHFGMPEMPVILREHNNPICKKIMELWWNEFNYSVQRDQLSFMYSIWKNGLTISDISSLGDDVRHCNFLKMHTHKKISRNVKNGESLIHYIPEIR